MLYKEEAAPHLVTTLESLSNYEPLRDFYLVGGTALALRMGHRRSDDIDLFTNHPFDSEALARSITNGFQVERVYHEPDTVRCFINGIKVDLIWHGYPLLHPSEELDSIRIASLPDIAAMKLNAISGRGLKKDFWDIAALLRGFTLEQMIGFFQAKYSTQDAWHLVKSLGYFDDAEKDQTVILSIWPLTWRDVKQMIIEATGNYLRNRM